MPKLEVSSKHIAIDKASSQMLMIAGICSFVAIFSLVASHSLWVKHGYLSRVSSKYTIAKNALATDISAYGVLRENYSNFESQTTNLIGGASSGSGTNQGDNAQIILDALPDQYDFPAVTSSIEKILKSDNFAIQSITGTDSQTAPQGVSYTGNPKLGTMPFAFAVTNANYSSINSLFGTLESSIRPITVTSLDISGGASNLTLTLSAQTYYQSGKSINITEDTVQ